VSARYDMIFSYQLQN